MDPILTPIIGSIISGVISGGAGLLGGEQAASNTSSANSAQMQYNAQAQYNQNVENASQAALSRAWSAQQLSNVEEFNQQSANTQMGFQDTEMGKAMDFDAEQAQLARDYTTQMSNTAYQRSVADMKAAGLNPILGVASGGASTPSSPSPTVSAPSGSSASVGVPGAATAGSGASSVNLRPVPDVFSPAISNALQGAQLAMGLSRQIAEIHNIEADTKNKDAGPASLIPALRRGVEDVTGGSVGDAVSKVKSVVSQLLPAPSPSSAVDVGRAVESLTGTPSNTLPSGAPANIPSLVPGALGKAINSEISSWLNTWMSPATTSLTPSNPAEARPYAGKVFSSSEIPTQGIMSGPLWKLGLRGLMQ